MVFSIFTAVEYDSLYGINATQKDHLKNESYPSESQVKANTTQNKITFSAAETLFKSHI